MKIARVIGLALLCSVFALNAHTARAASFASEVTANAPTEPMTEATQRLLLKGAFIGLSAVIPKLRGHEASFDRKLTQVLNWANDHYVIPAAITVGVLARKTLGYGPNAGINGGVEANFYLSQGKLMSTTYELRGVQGGYGLPVSDVEFYIALCFGDSCYGGTPNGWYVGVDANLEAGFFLQYTLDAYTLKDAIHRARQGGRKLNRQDFKDAQTFSIGVGFDVGIDAEAGLGLYHYHQLGPELTLSQPGQTTTPEFIARQLAGLKP